LKVIPLGGLGEIGMNMMLLEYGRNIIVIDAGVMFPENDMYGVDLVIPDFGYLREKQDFVRGIVITHGHEDHIGGLPYLLGSALPVTTPIYATRLTRGLIEVKLKRHKLLKNVSLHTIAERVPFQLGPFRLEAFHVNHSIPDAVGYAIETPVGLVVHTGDFKIDYTPVDGRPADFARLAELGGQGVLLLLSDSTGAERPGVVPSERIVGEALSKAIGDAPGRVIVTTFASLISRMQQVIDAAARHGRHVLLAGMSMTQSGQIAQELGYLQVPKEMLVNREQARRLPPEQLVVLATGSQGEPSSALARMAAGNHPDIEITPGDTVIFSAHPIPGNEELVHRTINRLFRRGARVIYGDEAQVHVSGHGGRDDEKFVLSLVRPRYFVPVHGEYRHLRLHADLATDLALPLEQAFVLENGQVLELDRDSARLAEPVTAGYVYIDGASVGDVGRSVLRDRELLSRHGFVVVVAQVDKNGRPVGRPQIVSRGFVYLREANDLLDAACDQVERLLRRNGRDPEDAVREGLGQFLYERTRRRPLVLPVIVRGR